MTNVILDHESIPAGTNASPANSGWDFVVPGTAGFITGEVAAALSGNIGLRLVCGTTITYVEKTLTPNTQQMERLSWKKFPTLPGGAPDMILANFYGGVGGNVTIARLILKATGEIYVSQVAAPGNSGIVVSAANGLPFAGQPFSLIVYLNSGTGTGDGTFNAWAYASPSTAAAGTLVGSAFTRINWDLGSGNNITRFRFGWLVVNAGLVQEIDYFQIAEGTTTRQDGVPAAGTPTVTASTLTTGTNSADIYPEAGQSFTLLATRGGTFTSGTWSNVADPSDTSGRSRPDGPLGQLNGAPTPSIATPTTAQAIVSGAGIVPGRYTFRHQVIGPGGTVNAYVNIYVHAKAGDSVGIWDAPGPWAVGGTVTTKRTAYSDASDTTFGESGDNPDGTDIDTIIVNPVGLAGNTVLINPRAYFSTGTGTKWVIDAYRVDGTTLIDSFEWNPAQDTPTEPADPFVLNLSALVTLASRYALQLKSRPIV